jgi:putative membrane protein
MNKIQHSVIAVLALGLAGVAQAQAPATPSPATGPGASSTDPGAASTPHQHEAAGQTGAMKGGKMASDASGADPAMFVKKAALGGMTEVELAKLAQSKSQDSKIKSFADRMVKDHGKANTELAGLAKAQGIAAPMSLDAEHQGMVKEMSGKSGKEFDASYSKHMVMDHDKTIALFNGATKNSNAELAAFAKKTLPTLHEHKQMADALAGASQP